LSGQESNPRSVSPADELSELYREIILEHSRAPRNKRIIAGAHRRAEGFNPLCGDRVIVYLDVDDAVIRDICFTGAGCAICTASASMMTEHLKGRGEQDARDAFMKFQSMVRGESDRESASGESEGFERLDALAGVQRFPMRVKCATLPWHTMIAALDQRDQPVSTE
jgi:nitrogen fixation NifU-like protein